MKVYERSSYTEISTGVRRPAFFFSSRRRHTRSKRDWSSDVCSSDLTSSQLPSMRYPLFGVQFHPESVLTECGYLMLGNWLEVCGLDGAAVSAAQMSP